jgi:exodeoxyribonuclease VIII
MSVLQPEEFLNHYSVSPSCDKRTSAGKIEWAEYLMEAVGKTSLTPEMFATISAMTEATTGNAIASQLLREGDAEVSVYWHDEETGLLCRCRPDYWRKDNLIVDLKTTDDASPEGFARSVAKYRYHVQAAYYMQGIEHATGTRPEGFVFIAIEKKPPYVIGVYVLDEASLLIGDLEFRADLNQYAQCVTMNEWPSYGENRVQTLGLPAWYLKEAAYAD